MSEPLHLAEASTRLRKRPGRPRKPMSALAPQASAPPAAPPLTPGNERTVAVVWLKQMVKDEDAPEQVRPEWTPATARLLSLNAAAAYVGVSTWTIRGWLADGVLARVKLPRPGGGEIERLLVDVTDLDRIIAEGKGP